MSSLSSSVKPSTPCDMHWIWQRVRRPFRYPVCAGECKWEIYDATAAGCLHCGKSHVCKTHVFEGDCPLITNDDRSRVCSITGYVIPEVRCGSEEYMDHVVFSDLSSSCAPAGLHVELDTEINKCLEILTESTLALQCRKEENSLQCKKLSKCLVKCIRQFKLNNKEGSLPNMCDLVTSMMQQEKKVKFIYPMSQCLKNQCHKSILKCLLALKKQGFKICIGNRLHDLIFGLAYLLRTGISYHHYELLVSVPEISRCLPTESRLKMYFNINSKIITSVENEVKLAFRDCLQKKSLVYA